MLEQAPAARRIGDGEGLVHSPLSQEDEHEVAVHRHPFGDERRAERFGAQPSAHALDGGHGATTRGSGRIERPLTSVGAGRERVGLPLRPEIRLMNIRSERAKCSKPPRRVAEPVRGPCLRQPQRQSRPAGVEPLRERRRPAQTIVRATRIASACREVAQEEEIVELLEDLPRCQMRTQGVFGAKLSPREIAETQVGRRRPPNHGAPIGHAPGRAH